MFDIHRQLLPGVEQVVQCVVGMGYDKGVEEAEPILLKAEHLHLLVVEVCVQPLARSSEVVTEHLPPYRQPQGRKLDIWEMVGQHGVYIFVNGIYCDGAHVGHLCAHDNVACREVGEGVAIHGRQVVFSAVFSGYKHDVAVSHYESLLVSVLQKTDAVECFAQIGSHGDATVHIVWLCSLAHRK